MAFASFASSSLNAHPFAALTGVCQWRRLTTAHRLRDVCEPGADMAGGCFALRLYTLIDDKVVQVSEVIVGENAFFGASAALLCQPLCHDSVPWHGPSLRCRALSLGISHREGWD